MVNSAIQMLKLGMQLLSTLHYNVHYMYCIWYDADSNGYEIIVRITICIVLSKPESVKYSH